MKGSRALVTVTLMCAVSLFAASGALAQTRLQPHQFCVDDQCPTDIDVDLSAIPWHNAAGPWGPQVPLQLPEPPNTNRSVNVATREQFNQAASVPQSRITITSSWAGNTTATINASDIDVVLPTGVSVGAIELGVWPRTSPISRIRIGGPIPGRHSGGRMGQYRDFSLASDITIDGIDLNGDSNFGTNETNGAFRAHATRIAVLNTRAIAAGYIWMGDARQVIISHSNFFHGAATRAAVGFQEGWGVRNTGGPLTIVDSRIQGTRYNNLRVQPRGPGDLLYVARTTFVNTSEGGRVAWLWDNMGNNSLTGQGGIIEDSVVYSYGPAACTTFPDLRAVDAMYSRVRSNQFFSGGTITWSQSTLNSMTKLAGGDHDWSVGNAFAPLTALPPWEEPGDPRQIPLPVAASFAGEAACLSPF